MVSLNFAMFCVFLQWPNGIQIDSQVARLTLASKLGYIRQKLDNKEYSDLDLAEGLPRNIVATTTAETTAKTTTEAQHEEQDQSLEVDVEASPSGDLSGVTVQAVTQEMQDMDETMEASN
jgi:hypothetical protein